MALYKYGNQLQQSQHGNFDLAQSPGSVATDAGIYRCTGCGDEIGIAKGHTLPPQNHRQHNAFAGPIKWQLLVAAVQKP